MTAPTWRDLFGADAQKRLAIDRRGTGAVMVAHVLATASPERAEQLLADKYEPAFANDPKTLKLVRELVNRKRAEAGVADAVERLVSRGEHLQVRARRLPRSGAFRLSGIWGGRRWR